MNFEGRLAQANGRLKAGNIGISIDQRGGKLGLRGILPPKPSSGKTRPYQQRINLGVSANPAGLKVAESEARKVSVLRDSGEFDWSDYSRLNQPETVGEWCDRFERDYFTRRKRTPQTETTWRYDYQRVFNKLPHDEQLTDDVLIRIIQETTPDTRTRRRFVEICQRLANFASLDADLGKFKGNYSHTTTQIRDLPPDQVIAEVRESISNPNWKRLFGLLATYGLRPHEVFHLDFSEWPIVQVGKNTKTGQRRIYPFYPEWAKEWQLLGDLPDVSGKSNTDLGQRVSKAFQRYHIPFAPYDLRHSWAVRSMQFGLDISLAAQQMGHSVQVHTQIYHRWISAEVHQRAYEVLMNRSDRPLPP